MPVAKCDDENCQDLNKSGFCSTELLLSCLCFDIDDWGEPVEVLFQPESPLIPTEEEERIQLETYWAEK